jgi:hypothetical protein
MRARLPVLAVLAVLVTGLLGFAGVPSGAQAQEPPPTCAATGYVASSPGERQAQYGQLVEQPVQQVGGVRLDGRRSWVLPDGGQPTVVIDSSAPVSGGDVFVTVAGQELQIDHTDFDQAQERFVTNVRLPHLGPTLRSVGLTVQSGQCRVELALAVDRSVWSTWVGLAGIALTALSLLLLVLVARLRKGGWLRRFLFAAPFGLLAGFGQAVVLYEAGVLSPFAPFPWWLPVVGLALAALLPLTRWRRRRPPAAPRPLPPPPPQAPLAGYLIEAPVARTEVAGVYRAVRPEGTRELVKVALAERYGEPISRIRLEREARALSGMEHPNLLRLRGTIPAEPGPPVLVFDDVNGGPLPAGLPLSGPQAVTIVLEVLAGLREVHGRELVHRDVRPENVWLTADGRVVLAGFELAAPGVENPLMTEGVAPYASPEQLAGQVVDARADLWACGALLAQLLTGQVPPDLAAVPEPVGRLLMRALSADPAARPASAEAFAAELREAAGQAYGPDWVGRGLLAGALATHGAIGAAAGGYAIAGGTAGTAGAAAGGVGAGVGGAPIAAGTAAAGAGAGSVAAASSAAPVAHTTSAVSAAAAPATASSGPVATVVNVLVSVVAAAAVAAGAVLADPEPAQAQPLVITPGLARVIFERTMAEGWAEDFTHYAEAAQGDFETLLEESDALADGQLAEIVVAVRRDQRAYPAWFVASALIQAGDVTASVFARFERQSEGEPWLMMLLHWSTEFLLPAPVLDDGWLAPPPTDLLVDPAELPERYHDWLVRANEAGEIGSDELLELRYPESGMIAEFTLDVPFFEVDEPGEEREVSYDYEMSVGEVVTELIPLVDGTVHVTFTSVIHQTTYNAPGQRTRSCDDFYLFWTDDDPPGTYRWISQDIVIDVDGWVPVGGAQPPAPPPAGGLEPEPVDPDRVVIEDWRYHTDNRDGEPC